MTAAPVNHLVGRIQIKPRHKMDSLTLEHVKKFPDKIKRFKSVHIWSDQWSAWWRDGGSGYTDDIQAGIFTPEEAYGITCHCGKEKRIIYYGCELQPNSLILWMISVNF